ncbi:MAG: hypothetical protein AAGB30_10980 [Pedobacter sp.]
MAIIPKFRASDFDKIAKEMIRRAEQAIISRFQLIGEEFVNSARSKTRDQGGFGNVTGNLRSSISYVILNDGRTVLENIEKSGNGSEGVSASRALIRELKGKYTKGYVLIVFAAMKYAAAVESRGMDVITGSSLVAERSLRKAIEVIENKIAGR